MNLRALPLWMTLLASCNSLVGNVEGKLVPTDNSNAGAGDTTPGGNHDTTPGGNGNPSGGSLGMSGSGSVSGSATGGAAGSGGNGAAGSAGEGKGKTCGGVVAAICEDGLFCSFSANALCGSGDRTGTCLDKPQVCDVSYAPVCGCDGKTYGNECSAQLAGTSAASQGECASGAGGDGGTGGTSAGAGGDGGTGGSAAGASGGHSITDVAKSAGCGTAFAGTSGAKVTIQTMGTKAANCADKLAGVPKCGDWSTPRDYYVYLPAGYDKNKAYPLVLMGPGCGGNGTTIYPLTDPYPGTTFNADETVIRVGLTPGPNSLGHGTNENQGCFDEKEGDDSIDWVFYENLYDQLNQDLCFDRNRVFSGGTSSGAWLSNELGCKYAGDAMRPVRGIMPNTGGLPTDPKFVPTCTTKPMAGMWVHEIADGTNAFAGNKVAIDRALKVNGCTGAASYDAKVTASEIQNFPIGSGNPDSTCSRLMGCPTLYPLVVCALPGNQHTNHDNVANPGFSTFVRQFSAPPFLP